MEEDTKKKNDDDGISMIELHRNAIIEILEKIHDEKKIKRIYRYVLYLYINKT